MLVLILFFVVEDDVAELGVVSACSGWLGLGVWFRYLTDYDWHWGTHKRLEIIGIHIDNSKHPQKRPDHNPQNLKNLIQRPPIINLHKHTFLQQHIMQKPTNFPSIISIQHSI